MALRMKGENFAWKLSEELLRRELPPDIKHEHPTDSPPGKSAPDVQAELLLVLRRELDIKNEQITQQGKVIGAQIELISGLSERLREGNILIGTLQQRVALTDGRPKAPTDDAKAKPVNATPPKPESKTKSTGPAAPKKGSAAPPKTAKPKPGFFARLFQ
ncbi:MAG TPA: hypothetical protein VHR66_10350 [Gemmataceae bacterium]|nr:hypothetical protein [Gemmataceae bacterium]